MITLLELVIPIPARHTAEPDPWWRFILLDVNDTNGSHEALGYFRERKPAEQEMVRLLEQAA